MNKHARHAALDKAYATNPYYNEPAMTKEDRIELIRDALAATIIDFAFEVNDALTWQEADAALRASLAKFPWIYDYIVVCDDTINAENTTTLKADVAFKLEENAHFIFMPISLGIGGIQFADVE